MKHLKIGEPVEVINPAHPEERFGILNAGPYHDKHGEWWSIRFEGRNVSYCLTPTEFRMLSSKRKLDK